MSQMFSPFFSLTFLPGIAKTPITPIFIKKQTAVFFSGKQEKMRILRCCIHALQFSRHHAPVTLESPRHPQREKTRNSEKVIFWRCTYNATEKKSYICAIKNGRSNVQKKNQKLAHST